MFHHALASFRSVSLGSILAGSALAATALFSLDEAPARILVDPECSRIEKSLHERLYESGSGTSLQVAETKRHLLHAAQTARYHCRKGRTEQAIDIHRNVEREVAQLQSSAPSRETE